MCIGSDVKYPEIFILKKYVSFRRFSRLRKHALEWSFCAAFQCHRLQGHCKDYKNACIVRLGSQIPQIFVKIRQIAISVGIFACLIKVPNFLFWSQACDFLTVQAGKFLRIGMCSGTLVRQTGVSHNSYGTIIKSVTKIQFITLI